MLLDLLQIINVSFFFFLFLLRNYMTCKSALFVTLHVTVGGADGEVGLLVKAFVLDIAMSDGLVDLSLKPELVGSANLDLLKKVCYL